MNRYLVLAVLVMGAITFISRALPFMMPARREDGGVMEAIRRRLPAAIMLILTIYCLMGSDWETWPHGIPELVAVGGVACLHLAFRSMTLSVVAGTALYLVLKQVF